MLDNIRRMSGREKITGGLYFLFGIVLIIFLLMNNYSSNMLEFELEQTGEESGFSIYTPGISLPAGEYSISFSYSSGAGSDAETRIENKAGEVFYSGNAGNTGKISLDKTETELIVKTDGAAVASKITVTSDGEIFNDKYFLAALVLLALAYLLYIKFIRKGDDSDANIHLFLIALGLFSSYPLYTFYLQYGHDLLFHLFRIDGIAEGLQSGQFPVRIYESDLNGYGYGVSMFYPELFLYVPALLRLIGVSQVTAYKTLLVAANIATAFIAYYSVKGVSKSKFAGLIGSAIYTLGVWRAINLYGRGALGEVLSMIFFPMIILGVYHILFGDKNKWYILALACVFMFQSHIIGTFISALLIIVMLLINIKSLFKDGRIFGLIKAGAFALALCLWYIIPFVSGYFSMDLVIKAADSTADFQNGAAMPLQLFNVFSNWRGASQSLSRGLQDEIPLSMGVGATIALVACAVYFIRNKNDGDRIAERKFTLQMFIMTLILLFMSTYLFPWDYLRDSFAPARFFENTLQFPWRLLSVSTALSAAAGSAVLAKYCDKYKKTTFAVLCVVLGLSFIMYGTEYSRNSIMYAEKGEVVSLTNDTIEKYQYQYLDVDTDPERLEPDKYTTSDGSIDITEHSKDGSRIELSVSGQKDGGYVEVPLYYYPGYTARDDNGNKLDVSAGDNGVVRIGIDGETGDNITVKFGCAAYTFGDIVSLLTILVAIAYAVLKKRFNIDAIDYLRKKLNRRAA